MTVGRPTSITNALSQTVGFQYDAQRRVTQVTQPEFNYTRFTYNTRGNVTETRWVDKPGSGLADIVVTAAYPSTCANPVTCNLPTATTDARGFTTDYTYHSTHGGVLTVTAPAPSTGADRPQTRYTYEQKQARYRNSATTFVNGSAIWVPTQTSQCIIGTSCANTANELRISTAYPTTSTPNNLLPLSVTSGSGDGAVTSTSAFTWTPNGDVETVDGPLSGTADTTRYRHDTARQIVGVIGPDPDGGGAGLNRAERYTYNPRGQVALTETGTTVGYTDPNWAAFAPLIKTAMTYDGYGRPIEARQQSAAGATAAVRQISYDAAGRVSCAATRMNPATFGSLPSSACTAGTAGSAGPDRITLTTYDVVGRPETVTTAYGLAEAVTTELAYTANGQVSSLTDGNGNVSIQVYDGFDRPSRLRYPNPTGGGTSTTDYEEIGYDAASNVISGRNRAGQTTTIGHDNLNRITTIDAPSGTMDVVITYDNLGRTLTSTGNSQTLTNVWDPLSRLTSETGPLGTMSYQYDAAGRMTRITWPDAFYATYAYDQYGAVTSVRENGAASGPGVLATYVYNDLGQPTGITRGNGASSTFGYDAFARMTSLAQNPSGSADDMTLGFNYSPAGQIVQRTVSNPAYVLAPVTGAVAYTNDGLNRVTTVGGAAVSYDANRNITAAPGAGTYGYDAANRLTSATPPGGTAAAFAFDPNDRLYQAGVATRFQYAGVQMVGEYNASGALTRRHVPGMGLDGVIASYDGSGTTNRSWLLADERGSVIGLTGSTGAVSTINRYDEYGVPAPGNAGRFQYTGQAWLAEAGAYHYRARAYLPEVGRFLQPDPVGYAAGANLYAYVSADPTNRVDPFGLQATGTLPDVDVYCRDNWICDPDEIEEYLNLISMLVAGYSHLGPEIYNAGQQTYCTAALAAANQSREAVARARQSWPTLVRATAGSNISPAFLAAIGVRESGFQNIRQIGGGHGRGIFQIDLGANPSVREQDAFNLEWSARWAANRLSSNMGTLQRNFSFSSSELLQATAASYNFGLGNISGNPRTIDVGTTNNNYGANVLNLMSCFSVVL